jgi:hypothetical protein
MIAGEFARGMKLPERPDKIPLEYTNQSRSRNRFVVNPPLIISGKLAGHGGDG